METRRINYKAICKESLDNIFPILQRLLPNGKVIKNEYVALNPTRIDHKLGSFRINLQTGVWADFATGDKGGDLISLTAYICSLSQAEAAKNLGSMLSMEVYHA